jgi:hypothetical protein
MSKFTPTNLEDLLMGPYSQPLIFFLAYDWAHYAVVLIILGWKGLKLTNTLA